MAMSREGRSRLNISGLCADSCDPTPNRLGNELRAIVRPDEGGSTSQDEQVGKHIDHIRRVQPALHLYRQALAAVLIQNVQCSECLSVIGLTINEVIAPDMVSILRPQPDA